ncbi:hypothetical protein [Brevundimonas nasdae]|nr:hypothetical protein [Brevundimonas nasdae]
MTTAKDVSLALAQALARPYASVEAYGLALRRNGWWDPAKRGRGARAMTTREAAQLLLAVLSEGPSTLGSREEEESFFKTYSTLQPSRHGKDQLFDAVAKELEIDFPASFLDYIEGFVRLFRNGKAEEVIHVWAADPHAPAYEWRGPTIHIEVSGPYPRAEISFSPSAAFSARHALQMAEHRGIIRLDFHLATISSSWVFERDGYENVSVRSEVDGIFEAYDRGVRFARIIGAREVDAVAKALAKPVQQ